MFHSLRPRLRRAVTAAALGVCVVMSPFVPAPSGAVASPGTAPSGPAPSVTDAQSAQQAEAASDQRVLTLRRVIDHRAREISALTTQASRADQD